MAESPAAPTVDPAVLEQYWATGSPTAALYAVIDDLRAVYPTTAGERTLDAANVDDIRTPPPPDEWEAQLEPVDSAQVGIAVMLGGSALAVLGLVVAALTLHLTG